MAHRRLPAFAVEYLEGGAEEEATLVRNLAALASYRLLPRALVNVSRRDQSVSLFGRLSPLPFAIAPTGLNGLFWRKADVLLARAAARAGVPFIQSTMSNDRMEEVAAVPDVRHWWQLYVFGPREIREALMARAQRAQCEALVITVDAQFYGDREWEQRRFAHPGRLTIGSISRMRAASSLGCDDSFWRHAQLCKRSGLYTGRPTGVLRQRILDSREHGPGVGLGRGGASARPLAEKISDQGPS